MLMGLAVAILAAVVKVVLIHEGLPELLLAIEGI